MDFLINPSALKTVIFSEIADVAAVVVVVVVGEVLRGDTGSSVFSMSPRDLLRVIPATTA